MKILSVVDTAYRATLEEQDDTSIWFNHACKNNGAPIDILLTGNAVNYGIKDQDPKPLLFGGAGVHYPNKFHEDLENFAATGARVFYIGEDADQRGIDGDNLTGCLEKISRSDLADLVDTYDQIWHW